MNNEEIIFQEKIKFCSDLLQYFKNFTYNKSFKEEDKAQVKELVEGLKKWSTDLRIRQLYYDV